MGIEAGDATRTVTPLLCPPIPGSKHDAYRPWRNRLQWTWGLIRGGMVSMTKSQGTSRKTKKIVRTPATRLAHLEKRIRRRKVRQTPKPKPG